MFAILCQTLFTLSPVDAPVRFGVALPAAALEKGISLRTGTALSVRELPLRTRDGFVFVEIAAIPASRRITIDQGGPQAPAAFERIEGVPTDSLATSSDRVESTQWRYVDGTIDERRVHEFLVDADFGGDRFHAGEAKTVDCEGLRSRWGAVLQLPRAFHERVGFLPAAGPLARSVREHLCAVAHAMRELPSARGEGDYARSGGIVTNLEFDTTLAMLRLGLALNDAELLGRARRSALHLCDIDLDARTGLPFQHGVDHRSSAPEPGHVWLQGLLWAGAVFADDRMLVTSQRIARALAALPAAAEGEAERARDYAWPLRELEAYLSLRDDPVVAAAADSMAAAIAARYRPDLRTFCFGEGAFVEGDGYFERAWLTGGVVVPALRAYLERRPDRELQRALDDTTAALMDRIGQGRGGIPTHWRTLRGSVFAEHRAEHDPKAFLMLECAPRKELARLLQRAHVQRGLSETPSFDDPDLATSFSMIARCEWVYR